MMPRWIAYWTAAMLLTALGGCDTFNQAQFLIPDPSPANRDRVMGVVKSAAVSAGMVDRTDRSKVTDTLIYFEEPVEYFPTTLGARGTSEYIVIDLACFHPGSGESPAFSVTKKSLESALKTEFGTDWQLVTKSDDRIPITRNPESPAPP
jgi:hypothetical protein